MTFHQVRRGGTNRQHCDTYDRIEIAPGRSLPKGTWDFAIIDEAAPAHGEIVIRKSRPSCFAGTSLETHLRSRGIRRIAINVGVEWTLREASSREFNSVLIEDATMAGGPEDVHRASVYNVERFIGWVTTTTQFETACRILANGQS